MPTFRSLNHEQVEALFKSRRRGDLTAYLDFLRELEPGQEAEIVLRDGERRETVKRRLSRAAYRLHKPICYRVNFKRDGVIRFFVQRERAADTTNRPF
jgi:hypothetical protein